MNLKRKANEIQISRIYNAPKRLVWEAWVDPKRAAHWWGPRGFTITTESKDLRPGGQWIYTMHGPDGVDYPNIATYHEVVFESRLVYDHGATATTPPLFRVTVTFEEKDGKTFMEMTMALETAEAAEAIKGFIKQANGYSTWDRLGEYLEKQETGRELFLINRSFKAPIDKVYDLWTKPEHIKRWLPPTGFEMEYLREEVRPGGNCFFKMFNSEGVTMFGTIRYKEMSRPYRLLYVQDFRDADEKLSRHPMLDAWPESMQALVTFTKESDDETRVTVQWTPADNATAEELKAFIEMRTSMTMGWTGSFDKLETMLAKS